MVDRQTVCIIGGGAAGIMCACHLDPAKYEVHLYEKTSRLGRKLLVAGEGGFNLTYHEPLSDFCARYQPAGFMDEAISNFDSRALRQFLLNLGIETYVGSSSRVFPVKGIKPYMVVNKLIKKLTDLGVTVKTDIEWMGWHGHEHSFSQAGANIVERFDKVIFALGGASWKKTGSTGSWLKIFLDKGIKCKQFEPSNCGWNIKWPSEIEKQIAGKPLKNIAVTVAECTTKGEAMITAAGLEGGALYAQADQIRSEIALHSKATILLDLKPDMNKQAIVSKLNQRTKSVKHTLRNELKLSETAVLLLRHLVDKADYADPAALAHHIKFLQLETRESDVLDNAISTVGGVALEAIAKDYSINGYTDLYAIGEMLDWDTRTGGYLLQGCFSQAVFLAQLLNKEAMSK